ncbi:MULTISPECIES: pantoate--beta-alanine ligase [unclassified Lysobacter]|uniref:pantoate--beta-alanine ligase n=1 Tax=unclassified Lysobacter TaxID=2635362 RepID=UPI0006FF4F6F|nr:MULTISPECIES: pantoate--beta-alanine ligase [unclassified Lysobacter]KQZ67931.1 pantoate--beta-alanine ligase [Lysobacter sp. Root559]KRC38257.1 pantoate--beta-alanine ligase [Lysobacter sp. Root76]KRD69581.1 pantoate--beta-alanine ligase [Lysobacter sp. Root96]
MLTVDDLAVLRSTIDAWRREGLRVAFVPTMGNLHAGHHSLVKLARVRADRVVVSVFVNPTQFGPNEDYGRYPRTPEADAAGLAAAGADLMWLPSVETMYPYGPQATVQVQVPHVTDGLEGAHRPGHFDGVATVVARLFNQVRPDVAVFGRKDYQQLAVIRYLVHDLAFPIEIVAGDTLREADGLAMSSRNQYLSAEERPRAAEIHRCLQWMRQALQAGTPRDAVEAEAALRLETAGFVVDYAAIRRQDLGLPETGAADAPRVALIAARLGRTRLIDNLEFAA